MGWGAGGPAGWEVNGADWNHGPVGPALPPARASLSPRAEGPGPEVRMSPGLRTWIGRVEESSPELEILRNGAWVGMRPGELLKPDLPPKRRPGERNLQDTFGRDGGGKAPQWKLWMVGGLVGGFVCARLCWRVWVWVFVGGAELIVG